MAAGKAQQPWEYSLRKYLLLLATLVVTVTYAAGFNPPGGLWQDSGGGRSRLAGDPIIRDTDYDRYLAFFYCNATAFAASLVLIVLILILAIRHAVWLTSDVVAQRYVMVVDLLSLMGAYGAGTCRDTVSAVYTAGLVAAVFAYIVVLKLLSWWFPDTSSDSGSSSGSGSGDATPVHKPGSGSTILIPVPDSAVIPAPVPDSDPVRVQEEEERLRRAKKKLKAEERLRKVLMLLATFAVSITYIAGLSTPGGFWDTTGGSHNPGDAILKDHHGTRLTVFLLCNTTAFVASLLIIMLTIDKKLRRKTARSRELFACIIIALAGLVGAYTAGSCRETDTTVYVVSLVGAVLAFILLLHGFFYTSPSKWLCCSCSRPAKRTDDNVRYYYCRAQLL